MYEKGVLKVKDLFGSNGQFLSCDQINDKYNLNLSFLGYLSLKSALPKHWKQLTHSKDDVCKAMLKANNKDIYNIFIDHLAEEPTCISGWRRNGQEFTKEEWNNIFTMIKQTTINTQTQALQLKILHRIYACSSYVSKFDKTVSKYCKYCKAVDDIQHCFVNCEELKPFWTAFTHWIHENLSNTVQIEEKLIIFGINKDSNKVVSYCILLAKVFIHRTRKQFENSNDIIFSFNSFLEMLKSAINVETLVKEKNNQIDSTFEILNSLIN